MATEIENLQAQIDDIRAKLCAVGTILSDYCTIAPKVEIPAGAFVHIDGSKGNANDQTGHGYNAVQSANSGAPTYDAATKAWNFTGSKTANQGLSFNPNAAVTDIPGLTPAQFAATDVGTRSLGAQIGSNKARTF